VPKHDNNFSTLGNQLSQNANPPSNTPNTYDTYLSVLPKRSSESTLDKYLLTHSNEKTPPIAHVEQGQSQHTTTSLNAPTSQPNMTNSVAQPYMILHYNNYSKMKKAFLPYNNWYAILASATPN
jgi:hypothetical protein